MLSFLDMMSMCVGSQPVALETFPDEYQAVVAKNGESSDF